MSRVPFKLPDDLNGRVVAKFLDAFETVRFDMGGEPKYYGDLHPDSHFIIRKHVNDAGDEHITFYNGAAGETLTDKWADRAALTYVEYDAVY